MYILVNKDDIQVASIRDAYHETMPDGRVILSGSELKMAGSIANCQIVATARQLRDLADRQREELSADGVTDTDLPGGEEQPVEEQPVDTPVTPGTDVDSDGNGLTGEDTDENEEAPGSSPSDDTDDTVTEDGEAGQETDITVNTNMEE